MYINNAIKTYIINNGIKQSYLSKKTNIPVDTLSKILNCKRKITAEEMLQICDALCIDPRALCKGNSISA